MSESALRPTVDTPRRFPACDCRRRRCRCAGGLHSFRRDFQSVLDAVRPRTVMEWGPGLNTALALARPGCRVFAVENDSRWVPPPTDARFECLICHAHSASYVQLHGREESDLFFIDGRRRSECLLRVFEEAHHAAVVGLHDAQRRRYHVALAFFPFVQFLSRGFALASRSPLVRFALLPVAPGETP